MTPIETIRAMYAAFAAKDYEAFAALCAPELVWIQNPGFPGGGTHHGAAAVVANVFKAFGNEWASFRFVPDEEIVSGSQVVIIGRYEASHRESRKLCSAATAHVYDVSNGKIVRFRQFTDTHTLQLARIA